MLTEELTGYMAGYLPGPRVSARTADGWSDAPYDRFELHPQSPTIGAHIEGISLTEPVDDELFEQLNRALIEWKVLVFRHQSLSQEQHAEFARHWGALETHPFYGAVTKTEGATAEIVRLEKSDKVGGFENVWHSDVTWREEPSLGSVLRAVEVPEIGGDTLWADMGAAYDRLSDGMKDHLDGLVAVHDWYMNFGLGMDPAERDRLRPDFPAVEHPVVRTHPESGRKTLYVNRAFTQHIKGMSETDSVELLNFLYLQATFPEYQFRHRWQPGDVVFWDNRSTQHYASSDYFPARRVMERLTVVGDRPA